MIDFTDSGRGSTSEGSALIGLIDAHCTWRHLFMEGAEKSIAKVILTDAGGDAMFTSEELVMKG